MTSSAATRVTGTAHQVTSDAYRLFVWEKQSKAQRREALPRVALLVHGGTYGGPTDYDVQVPGRDYSLMDYLAARGWDVFTFDIRGYGRSDKPEDGFSVTTAAAVRDIDAVVQAICQMRGVAAVDLMGWSWGGSTTALYASQNPKQVRRLVMFAGGAGVPSPAARRDGASAPLEPWVVSTRESVMARVE